MSLYEIGVILVVFCDCAYFMHSMDPKFSK